MTKETAEELNLEEETTLDAETLTDGDVTDTEAKANETDSETENKADKETNEEVIPTFGEDEETPPQEEANAPEWVKELRIANRNDKKTIRELQAKIDAATDDEQVVTLGQKPTFEQFDYDEDKYVAALDKYNDKKREVEASKSKAQDKVAAQDKAYQGKLTAYTEQSASFDATGFKEAEDIVKESLNEQQQSVIVDNVDKSAAFVMALSRSPKLRAELAGVKDLGAFIYRVGQLSGSMKMTKRKPRTSPESKVSGTASSNAFTKKIDAAREKGDIKEVMRLRRAQT